MIASMDTKDLVFLVVDDQFNVRRMVVNFLRSFGYTRFVDASDGDRAWEKLKTDPVDFIICDWNMPRMPGIELLRLVRGNESFRHLPFLMVTAEMAEDLVAEAAEWQVDDYILKPFQAQTLKEKIDHIMERRLNPSELDLALMDGTEHMRQGRGKEALASYQRALDMNPKSARSHAAVGSALELLGEDEQAIGHYREAVKISKRFLRGHDSLARVYRKQGEVAKAAEHARTATTISPRNPHRQVSLGKLLLEKGDKDEAAKVLAKAQEIGGHDSELMAEVGEALLAADMNEEAAEAFSSAVDLNPNVVHLYNRLGIALRRQKRFDEAVEQYRRALKVAPDDENLYYNMAVALAEAGKREMARKALAEALRLQPQFQEARDLMQRLSS